MGTALITETHLTSIANAIRGKNGSSTTYTPEEMAPAITAIQGSSFERIYTGELTYSTTSTTAATATTIALGSSAYTKDKILYVRVRDKAGPRAGYFYGTDAYYDNYYKANGATTTMTVGCTQVLRYTTSSAWASSAYAAASAYGVYAYSLSSAGSLIIRGRYSSSYSLTVNGTYTIDVYLVTPPKVIFE